MGTDLIPSYSKADDIFICKNQKAANAAVLLGCVSVLLQESGVATESRIIMPLLHHICISFMAFRALGINMAYNAAMSQRLQRERSRRRPKIPGDFDEAARLLMESQEYRYIFYISYHI
jgi:hypothetical protein